MSSRKGKGRSKKSGNDDGGFESIQPVGIDDPVAQRRLLISAWEARDELYKQLFGEYTYVVPAAYAAPSEIISIEEIDRNTVDGGSGDPGDPGAEEQHLAILAYGPDPLRPYWTYVTAGLCSPWLQQEPSEVSGFGCELMIKSPEDGTWQPQILRSLAFSIFNHAGPISPGVKIGLNAPIKENSDSLLRNLFVWYPDEAPDCWYQIPSGGFGLFCAVGITDDELRYAESVDEYGVWSIQEVMRQVGLGQISDPQRPSIVTESNAERLNNARNFANNFGAEIGAKQNMADLD